MAPHPCSSCGFFVTIKGTLGAGFGVCANEMSPADGKVVSVGFGCGAHSGIVAHTSAASLPEVTLDENEYEIVTIHRSEDGEATTQQVEPPTDVQPQGDGEVTRDLEVEHESIDGESDAILNADGATIEMNESDSGSAALSDEVDADADSNAHQPQEG